MSSNVVLDLDVELDEAVHGDRDGYGLEYHNPNMGESGVERFEAVSVNGLSDDCDEGEEDANETVLKYAHPDHLSSGQYTVFAQREIPYVKPGQAASGSPQPPFVSTACAFLEIFHGPDPFPGCDGPEVDLLLMEIRGNVGAKQTEERGYRECLVTVSDDLKVDTVIVIVV